VTAASIRNVLETLRQLYGERRRANPPNPYEVLVSVIISQRTRDEQTAVIAERVLSACPTVESLARADPDPLAAALRGSLDPPARARRLIELARLLVERHGGRVPDTLEQLIELPGVGRKTANCVLIFAFNLSAICVDTHVHRITNRLGWVQTRGPEQTERALASLMPRDLWGPSNWLFVQHGRALCLPGVPRCSRCPLRPDCRYGQDPTTRKN